LYGLRDEDFELNLRSGVTLALRRRGTARVGDIDIALEVLVQDVYQLREQPSDRPKFMIDVGAHIGLVCIPWLAERPDRSLLALEPDGRNFQRLCTNLDRNGLPVAFAANVALTAADAWRFLRADRRNVGVRVIRDSPGQETASQAIECWSCTTLLSRVPHDGLVLTKLDCEGTEKELARTPDFDRVLRLSDTVVIEEHGVPTTTLSQKVAAAGLTPRVLARVFRPCEGYFRILRADR
jgi:FkbM family methyltransferase